MATTSTTPARMYDGESRHTLFKRLLRGTSPKNPTCILALVIADFQAQSSSELTVSQLICRDFFPTIKKKLAINLVSLIVYIFYYEIALNTIACGSSKLFQCLSVSLVFVLFGFI